MIGTYKEFYKFVKQMNPSICNLWEDFHNRPDPNPGDIYTIDFTDYDGIKIHADKAIFDRIDFDSEFTNGVAFIYNFHDAKSGQKYQLHSINNVYDESKLTSYDRIRLYSFWLKCKLLNNK